MFYKALRPVIIMHQHPNASSPQAGNMFQDEIGRQEVSPDGETSGDGTFVFLVLPNPAPPRQGWVRLKNDQGDELLKEVAEGPPGTEMEIDAFIKECIIAERRFNDPAVNKTGFFIIGDFLIAWADIESGIKNIDAKNPLTDGTGPFQISTLDWLRFCASPFGEGFNLGDREIGVLQINGAAFLAVDAMSKISNGIGIRDPVAGPYVPSYVDVLLAMMLGEKAAVEIRKAKIANNGGTSVDAVLGPLFSADDLKKLIDFRGTVERNRSIDKAETVNFLKNDAGKVETIDGSLSNAENLLNSEFQTAFALIKEKDPDDLPKLDGTAPWMDVAQAQGDEWDRTLKNESTPLGKARVVEYFKAINVNATGTEPWCAAFVGYCLTKSNPSFATTVPKKDAGWAPNWANWGNVSIPPGQEVIPEGAIVTLSPGKETNKISHVGFCHSSDPNQVVILGGNQHDTVNLTPFPRSRIVAIRWFSQQGSDAANAADRASTGQVSKLLDFIARAENGGRLNPNSFIDNPGNQDNPRLTSMTIADVLNFQRNVLHGRHASDAVGKYQIISPTLTDRIKDGVVSSQDKFDDATQDKLGLALLRRRRLGDFLAGNLSAEEFGLRLAMEWASLPVPMDTTRKGGDGRIINIKAGSSYWSGVAGNLTQVKLDAFMQVVRSILV